MASLQARHARSCPLQPWTPAAKATKTAGCTCQPTWYVAHRHDGRLIRERIGRNRRDAERALVKIQHDSHEGTYVAPRNITFRDWADEWQKNLRRPKASTKASYESTIAYANEAVGDKLVRDIGMDDVTKFIRALEERGLTQSTIAKHLRVLGAVLKVAANRGLVASNPVSTLDATVKPRAVRREAAWFEDGELRRLAAELEGVVGIAYRLCLVTGLRQAEAIALTWGDISFTEKVISVRRTFTLVGGPTTPPKSGQRRDVHVTDEVIQMLSTWWSELGRPGDDVLVLPGPGGYLRPDSLLRALRAAMKRAGVPMLHPRTNTRRNWHSLRHSYARIVLERGASLSWLQSQLGHSSPLVTNIYAHWADTGKRQQAQLLEGAFAL